MNTKLVGPVFAAAALLAAPTSAQIFDLASTSAPTTVSVMPGKAPNLTLINRVPEAEYKIIVVVETRPIPPIPLPSEFAANQMFLAGFSVCDEKPLNAWLATLRKADDEQAVAAAASATAVGELRKKYSDTCWNELAQPKVSAAITGTRLNVDLANYSLKENQQLVVTVTRVAGSTVKSWTFTLQTAEAGHWLTTWGFGFAHDRDDHYSQKQLADGTFQITKERDPAKTDFKFIPAVYFMWMPKVDEDKNWSFSPLTVGIGLSKEAPSFMFGGSVTRRQNVSLIGGLAVFRSQRLDTTYSPDQILKEKVADDKIFENTYRPSLFFSLGIRFDKNPFATADDKKAKDDTGKGQADATQAKSATDEAAAKKKP